MKNRKYKTLGAFRFGDLWLGFQVFQNEWGTSGHRIVQLAPDLTTILTPGPDENYQHPCFFECQGRTFMVVTQYFDDGNPPLSEIIYELMPPPDSDIAQKNVESRADALMRKCTKDELGIALGLDSVMGVTKQELAERVIRLKDKLEELCR